MNDNLIEVADMRSTKNDREESFTNKVFPSFRVLLLLVSIGFLVVCVFLYTGLSALDFDTDLLVKVKSDGRGFVTILPGIVAYSAFLDNREQDMYVRVMAVVKESAPQVGWCHFWPPDSVPPTLGQMKYSSYKAQSHKITGRLSNFLQNSWVNLSTPMEFYQTCEGHGLSHTAYYLSCKVPANINYTLSSVIIARSPETRILNTENIMEFPITPDHKESSALHRNKSVSMAICVPPLFGRISPDALIEFIEVNRILGVNHFFFYEYEITNSVRYLLRFYTKNNLVTLLPWNIPIFEENIWYYGQSAAIGDCLYRTMGRFDWVIFSDIDEYIIPRKSETLNDFLYSYEAKDRDYFSMMASLRIPSVVFHKPIGLTTNIKIGKYITMALITRTESVSYTLTKQIVRPEKVFELGIHHLSKSIHDIYVEEYVDEGDALLHHYRKCRNGYSISCDDFISDNIMERYSKTLKQNAEKVHSQLKFKYTPPIYHTTPQRRPRRH